MFGIFRKAQDTIQKYLAKKFETRVSYEKEFSESRGKIKLETVLLDKAEDLDLTMVNKFIDSINQLVDNSQKANVELEIEFKDSILTCRQQGNLIVLRSIKPKDCNNFEEIAFFNGNKPLPLKQYLYEKVMSNEDIVELEKTMIRLI